jgi:two-component system chemotaxis response regulator CheB
VVDDSALIRGLLAQILSADPDIEVVAAVVDPHEARQKIKELNPDVITLDIEMPGMDGISFLERLMRLRPMPVVMISSLTQKGAKETLRALELGAVDFVSKPKVGHAADLTSYSQEIIRKVKSAAGVDLSRQFGNKSPRQSRQANATLKVTPSLSASAVLAKPSPAKRPITDRMIIAIGASTGGTEAIREVVVGLPADFPPILITQHIPPIFSAAFAERLNEVSAITVTEAMDGQLVLPGHAYVAPGDRHLLLAGDAHKIICRLNDGPPVNRHKPSVDVLFRSIATVAGRNVIAIILTGMGADGALGLLELKDCGAETIAQDEATSVVWGMPGAAVEKGAASYVVPLDKISEKILALLRKKSTA